jgi:hypothetical protein
LADDIATEAARRKIAATMIDALVDRLPGHTRTQRLALLRTAFHETRHRAMANPTPIDIDQTTSRPGRRGLPRCRTCSSTGWRRSSRPTGPERASRCRPWPASA